MISDGLVKNVLTYFRLLNNNSNDCNNSNENSSCKLCCNVNKLVNEEVVEVVEVEELNDELKVLSSIK